MLSLLWVHCDVMPLLGAFDAMLRDVSEWVRRRSHALLGDLIITLSQASTTDDTHPEFGASHFGRVPLSNRHLRVQLCIGSRADPWE